MVVNAILPIAYVVVVYYTMRFRYRLVQGLHAPNFGDNVVGAISLSPCYRESCFRDIGYPILGMPRIDQGGSPIPSRYWTD